MKNITLKIEFVDYRGSVKTRTFEGLPYYRYRSIMDEVAHLKKVNNWSRVLEVTSIKPKDF